MEGCPVTDDSEFVSLDRALRSKRVPLRNDTFIKTFLLNIGIEGVRETSGHIIAVRRDGGPNLNIGRGSTNGFVSEAEIIATAGPDARREPSAKRPGLWRVIHPEDPGGRDSGPLSGKTAKRVGEACPNCGMRLPLTGGDCGYC